MRIQCGIPNGAEPQAAALYWEAFGEKLGIVMGPRERGIAYVLRVLDPTHAISAVDDTGELLGVVGFKTYNSAFVGGDYRDITEIYGHFGGLWRAGVLSLLDRDVENKRFLMDGIFVAQHARGQGVGSALLSAITEEGRGRGYPSLRLDVIDKNTRAKALYERHGFQPGKTTSIGPLKHIFQFQRVTTMIKAL